MKRSPGQKLREDRFQIAAGELLDMILPPDADWCHTPNGGQRNISEAVRFKRMGVKAGDPDIRVIYQGKVNFMEAKVSNRPLSYAQIARINHLKACGCRVKKVESLEDVKAALQEFGIPIRNVQL